MFFRKQNLGVQMAQVGTVFQTLCHNRFLQVSCLFVFTDLANVFQKIKSRGSNGSSRDRFPNTVSQSFPPGLMFVRVH